MNIQASFALVLLLLRPTSFGNKSSLISGILVTYTCFPFVRVSLFLIPVLFEAPFYTIIKLKLKYLLFSYGTDTIKAGFSTIYGRFYYCLIVKWRRGSQVRLRLWTTSYSWTSMYWWSLDGSYDLFQLQARDIFSLPVYWCTVQST